MRLNREHLRQLAVIAAMLALVTAGVLLLRQSAIVLDAPLPGISAETVDTLPPTRPSVIEAPVTYDLDTAIDSLEQAVPTVYGDLERRIVTANNKHLSYAFLLRRSRFHVEVHGHTVAISAVVAYSGRAWYSPPVGPELSISCGTGNDLPPRAILTVESTPELTQEWGLRTRSHVVKLAAYSDSARDHCRLSFLRLDVTGHILDSVRELMDERLGQFDAVVARWPVRKRFEKIWSDLQTPLHLADSVYFTIQPVAAEVGSIGVQGRTAYANLRLIAAPRVTTGPRPKLPTDPLPPLRHASNVGRGARVLLDASFTYPVATAMLRRALVGRKVRQGIHVVRIRDVRLNGIGGGRVALGVWLAGDVRGRLFFTGTPTYDSSSHQITVPDLEYDVGTAKVLVMGYEWLKEVRLRDFLRDRARLPDSTVVHNLAVLAEKGLNRKLPARGTQLQGRIDKAGVVAVRATRSEIRVRALAEADIALSVRRAPSIPRPPALGEERDKEGEP
jgi:hypothetical protein